ncbi:hypothetical protein QBC47DRAFT_149867 [Echria macrotheca]|uniref:Apple domain-containing protein n=1 Tax=Echria macrotheca TaxID=438768 RepID=A0AAJ0F951_9PEZI|nr:hypothetical protein QBC47DRAFT_149867 [Echria macrotheca]
MDTPRLGTSHSQQSFIRRHELEHSAPEVVEQPTPTLSQAFPVYEKNAAYPPAPSYSPAVPDQPRQSYWAPSDFETVPPQYSTHYQAVQPHHPGALVVPPIEHAPVKRETICGIRRGLFIILLAAAGLLLLAIGVGVGVGVGVGGNRNASSGSTSSSPTATPTGSPGSQDSCPGMSSTQYSAANGKKFLHLCGLDYSGTGEATDITSLKTSTFAQCIEACAARDDCDGAGWGPLLPNGDNKFRQTCYLKKNLQTSHTATPEWNFAILLDDSSKAT